MVKQTTHAPSGCVIQAAPSQTAPFLLVIFLSLKTTPHLPFFFKDIHVSASLSFGSLKIPTPGILLFLISTAGKTEGVSLNKEEPHCVFPFIREAPNVFGETVAEGEW